MQGLFRTSHNRWYTHLKLRNLLFVLDLLLLIPMLCAIERLGGDHPFFVSFRHASPNTNTPGVQILEEQALFCAMKYAAVRCASRTLRCPTSVPTVMLFRFKPWSLSETPSRGPKRQHACCLGLSVRERGDVAIQEALLVHLAHLPPRFCTPCTFSSEFADYHRTGQNEDWIPVSRALPLAYAR